MKSISLPWIFFFLIVFSALSLTSSSTTSRSHLRKEYLSKTTFFNPRNQSLSIESSQLSPLIHHPYLQIQPTVQKTYTIQVGNLNDSNPNSNSCSTTTLRSTCNLRSAWDLCLSLIQAVTCPSSASQAVSVTCTIVLPSSSLISFNNGYGGAMTLSALSSWASTCKNTLVTLSITSPKAQTNITGDGTSTSLLYLTGIPFIRFTIKNVAVMGFGDGSVAFSGAVYLHSLLGATFGPGVQFGPNNVGYNTSGALVVCSLPSFRILSSIFVRNSAVVYYDYARGGALTIYSSNNILISNTTFVNNSLFGGYGYGGALYCESSNNITITDCKWLGNSNSVEVEDLGYSFASGGALSFYLSNTITLTRCSMVGNSNTGEIVSGGAMAFSSSNTITLTSCRMVGNSNSGGYGVGGALYCSDSHQLSIAHSFFSSNTADDGGAIYFDFPCTFIGMTAIHFSRNVALSGAGGAVYVCASCSYISFGGPMPMLETCKGVCDQAINIDAFGTGHSNTILQQPTNLQVIGYYVVFNKRDNLFSTTGDIEVIVGVYQYDFGSTVPGTDGEAPYFYHGSTMTINFTRYNDPTNPYISLWVFPLSTLSSVFENNIAATYGGAIYIGNSVKNVFVMSGTIFTDNSVIGSGGAVFLDSLSNNIYFYSTIFQGNNASLNGGAVVFQNLVTSIHFYDCTFASNSAQYGGGVYFGNDNGNDLSNTGLITINELLNATIRYNNAALDGGGIYVNFLNSLSLVGSRLVGNNAERSGGAFFLSQNNGPITIDSSIFVRNRASLGGAIAMNSINIMSISTLASFVHNSAGTDGGAIFSNANNTINSLDGSTITFLRNTCKGRGGALAMNTGSIITFNGTTTFDSNYAEHQGGAIAVSASSVVLGPRTITFSNNSALSGSAIYLSSSLTSSVDIIVPLGGGCTNQTTCTTPPGYINRGFITRAFYGQFKTRKCNIAPIILYTHELGVCTNSFENKNNGYSSGFGVYSLKPTTAGGFPQLLFEQYGKNNYGNQDNNPCAAANYQGYSVVVINTICTTDRHGDTYRYLSATPSTRIVVPMAPTSSVYSVSALFSGLGCTGALVNSSMVLQTSTNSISSYYYGSVSSTICTAPANGICNGYTFTACPTNGLTFATFTSYKPSTNWNKVLFRSNVCRKHGGTVFIIKDPQSNTEHFGSQIQYYNERVFFVDNAAKVGKEVATQTTSLRSASNHTTILITNYNFFFRPSLVFNLVDEHNNVNSTDFATTVTASVLNYHCGIGLGHLGYLSGVTTVVAAAGIVTFDAVSAYCFPLGNMTVQFQAQPSGFESSHYVTTTLTLVFRQCHDGEILVNSACQACPSGSYSFQYSPTAICTSCPNHTDSCAGGIITVSPGYWRLTSLTTDMLPCPFPNACIGGNGTVTSISTGTNTDHHRRLSILLDSTSGCAEGYHGPLCGVCSNNYYFDTTKQACLSCVGQKERQLSIMIIVLVVVLLFVLAVVLIFPDVSEKMRTELTNAGDSSVLEADRVQEAEDDGRQSPNTPPTKKIGWRNRLVRFIRSGKLMPKIKIVITAYQIVTTFPFTLNLNFPVIANTFLHVMSFVNLSAITLGSPACFVSFDYYDRLLLTTILPLVVFGVVICVFFPLHLWYYLTHGKDVVELNGRYIFCILTLAYLFLPNVTTTIFGSFSCTNIDPQGLVPGTPTFLRNDYSISCESKRYHQMNALAIVMIFVYPVGFTFMTCVLLYRAREEIKMFAKDVMRGISGNEDDNDRTATVEGIIGVVGGGSAAAAADIETSNNHALDQDNNNDDQGDVRTPASKSHTFAKYIGFLYEAYKPEYWYWEVVETIRRILMTAVMSIVATGSGAQIVFGIIVALSYMKLYSYHLPFKDNDDNVLQEVAQYQVFITLFVALLLRGDNLPGAAWRAGLDIILVIGNMITPICVLWLSVLHAYVNCWKIAGFIHRYIGCCLQSPSLRSSVHDQEEHVARDLSSAAVEAHAVLSSPPSISPRPHQRASSVRVHIEANTEKLPLKGQEEMDIVDDSAKTVLSQPMESIEQELHPRRLPSIVKEQLVALRVSGKELVDRLRTSGKSPQEGKNDTEDQESLLAVQTSTSDRQPQLMTSNVRQPTKYKKKRLNSDVSLDANTHHTTPSVRNVLLPPSVQSPPMSSSSSSSMAHRNTTTSTTQRGEEMVVIATEKTFS